VPPGAPFVTVKKMVRPERATLRMAGGAEW
jgi:hypothetical protein